MKGVGNEDLCFCAEHVLSMVEERRRRTKKGENVCALMFGRPWTEIQSLIVRNLNGEPAVGGLRGSKQKTSSEGKGGTRSHTSRGRKDEN